MSYRSLIVASLLVGACTGSEDPEPAPVGATSPCEEETRAQPLEVGAVFAGSRLDLEVMEAAPLPVHIGDNQWALMVRDEAGTPMVGCEMALESFMPDHGHGGPLPAVTDQGDGTYLTEVRLTMGGYWEIDVNATCGDLADSLLVTVCAE